MSDQIEHHHGTSTATLLWVFAALMVLLAITVAVSVVDLGSWSIFVAMAIAVTKAALVVLYFMQAKRSSLIIKAYAGAAAVWLIVGLILSFTDYYTRTPQTTLSPDNLSALTPNQPQPAGLPVPPAEKAGAAKH